LTGQDENKDTRRNGQPPKSQLAKKVNPLKTPNIAFWLFYAQVDFLEVDHFS
jgi:hypothetical protein